MKQNRKIIGLTGGVGSGKTTVIKLMEKNYGAKVFIADEIGHLAMKPGTETYDRICNLFGPTIVEPDQTLNHKKIAQIIFDKKDLKEKLNQIIHPFVWEYIWSEIEKLPEDDVIVIESAILFEADYADKCTKTWGVVAPESVRRERLINDRQYSEEKIDQIEKNQMSTAELCKRCDLILINAGDIAFLDGQIKKNML